MKKLKRSDFENLSKQFQVLNDDELLSTIGGDYCVFYCLQYMNGYKQSTEYYIKSFENQYGNEEIKKYGAISNTLLDPYFKSMGMSFTQTTKASTTKDAGYKYNQMIIYTPDGQKEGKEVGHAVMLIGVGKEPNTLEVMDPSQNKSYSIRYDQIDTVYRFDK